MEIFRNTNCDSPGKKWIFISASLALTAAGLISMWVKGGPAHGTDFRDSAARSGLVRDVAEFQAVPGVTVVAAILTLVGYSMNDTIVVFDRVGGNPRIQRREKLEKLSNDRVNRNSSRTVLTSGLSFVAALPLLVFGGPVLKAFAFAPVVSGHSDRDQFVGVGGRPDRRFLAGFPGKPQEANAGSGVAERQGGRPRGL